MTPGGVMLASFTVTTSSPTRGSSEDQIYEAHMALGSMAGDEEQSASVYDLIDESFRFIDVGFWFLPRFGRKSLTNDSQSWVLRARTLSIATYTCECTCGEYLDRSGAE